MNIGLKHNDFEKVTNKQTKQYTTDRLIQSMPPVVSAGMLNETNMYPK